MDKVTMANNLYEMFRKELKDFWVEEDTEFLKKLSQDIAEQQILVLTSATPEVHKKNLIYLAATLQEEGTIKALKLNKVGQQILGKLLSFGIKTMVYAAIA